MKVHISWHGVELVPNTCGLIIKSVFLRQCNCCFNFDSSHKNKGKAKEKKRKAGASHFAKKACINVVYLFPNSKQKYNPTESKMAVGSLLLKEKERVMDSVNNCKGIAV